MFLFFISVFLFLFSISVFYFCFSISVFLFLFFYFCFFIFIFLFPFQGVSHVYFSSPIFFGTFRAFRRNALLSRASFLPPLRPSSILPFLFKPSLSKGKAKITLPLPRPLFPCFPSFSKCAQAF